MSASYTDIIQIIEEAKEDCSSTVVTLENSSYEFLTIDTATQTLFLASQEDDESTIYEDAQLLFTVGDDYSHTIPIKLLILSSQCLVN